MREVFHSVTRDFSVVCLTYTDETKDRKDRGDSTGLVSDSKFIFLA